MFDFGNKYLKILFIVDTNETRRFKDNQLSYFLTLFYERHENFPKILFVFVFLGVVIANLR